jgi:predicted AAA+ superfamily ATPase
MERKIHQKLQEWKKSSNRKPLIVQGARQVGKTWSILNFGKSNYQNILYFNFESSEELRGIFERDLSPQRILRELSVLSGETILAEGSLIFFDEIQACERALTALKYFCEQAPAYHLIAAGSLLGVAVHREDYSFPVGKVTMLSLHPLDFEEFLWAFGQHNAVKLIRESFDTNSPTVLHQTFLDHYKTYLCIGGMPQVVKEFIESNDYHFAVSLQKNINDAYISDMAKYATAMETVRIMSVFNSIPSQLAKENKKFQYRLIKSGARAAQYEAPLDWLKASGIVLICQKISAGKFPLIAWLEPSSVKVYISDPGLLCSKYGISLTVIRSEVNGYNEIKGSLTGNYVATVLTANGYALYYWESLGKAEVDFVIQKGNGEVIPIEVKSSENVRSKSLQQFISRYNPACSIRVSAKNFGFENGIKSVPLYAVFCI